MPLDGDRAATYKDADLLLALQVVLLPMVLLVLRFLSPDFG